MQIREIRLRTSSIHKILDFYKSELLLNTTHVSQESTFTIHAGNTDMIFENSFEHSNYHFAFNIPSNKIEEAFTWLHQRVELLWLEEYQGYIADFDSWHAKSVYFFDPAGNIVEFIARFDLNDDVAEAFSPMQIRNVSEIGIVFPQNSFDDDVNALMKYYPIQYFNKQPPMKQFRAIGDDHGLFIVVPENRNWYPTNDRMAGIYPLTIRFMQNGSEFSITTG